MAGLNFISHGKKNDHNIINRYKRALNYFLLSIGTQDLYPTYLKTQLLFSPGILSQNYYMCIYIYE